MRMDHASDELKDIRPGLQVDIVVSTDYQKEITDVRQAIIYEAEKNRLVLSQTNPAFTRFYLNRDMVITYLMRREGRMIRVGVFGKLVDFILYKIASSEIVQAVVMNLKSGAEVQNLRMHFRVRPTSDQDISIYFDNERMNIIDISVGGAMLSRRRGRFVKPADHVKMKIVVEGERFEIDTAIVRVWSPPMERHGLEYISVQFLNLDKRLNYLLGGKIFKIERESRSRT